MRDFEMYSPEDTISLNLAQNAQRLCALAEQDISHLNDLAHELVEERDLQEILLSLPELALSDVSLSQHAIEANKTPLTRLSDSLFLSRRLLLCYSMCELLRKRGMLANDAFFSDSPVQFDENPHIIYQKSGYADSAYLRFASFFKEPHATYTSSFVSACEDVYNGLCDYCILPIESSAEGLLGSFFRLILKYDLKIAATCDVCEQEHRVTRFALLRRTMLPSLLKSTCNTVFEISFAQGKHSELSDLLTAASFFGIQTESIDSLPNEKEQGNAVLHLLFSSSGGDFEGLLMYLSMALPHYTPIGLYSHLSKKERT